jgi:hypothetical protein
MVTVDVTAIPLFLSRKSLCYLRPNFVLQYCSKLN